MSSEAETQQPPSAPATALSATDTKPDSTGSGAGSGGQAGLTWSASAGGDKKVIARKVLGTIKWFNERIGYGFINRNDTKEDIFVHQTAIKKNHPRKNLRRVGDGETVEFDVVEGEKGAEAATLVEFQFKVVNTQQTVTIIDAIHDVGLLQAITSTITSESREKNEEGQAQQRQPYRRRGFPPYYIQRPYMRMDHSIPTPLCKEK